jgi:hypothetical protein
MKFIRCLIKALTPQTRQQWIENYLSQSVDRYDLEARQRELTKKGIY